MCNFNQQDDDTKSIIHLLLAKAANEVGGANFFLSLLEAIKAIHPHPLMEKKCQIQTNKMSISWNKVIFKDKIDTLQEIIATHKSAEGYNFNILAHEKQKKQKNILNMVRALSPLQFTVLPKNENDGNGFSFGVFDLIENNNVTINPLFVAIFFCSTEFTKKALNYKI